MNTFYMFGTNGAEMFRDVSAGRTKEIESIGKRIWRRNHSNTCFNRQEKG